MRWNKKAPYPRRPWKAGSWRDSDRCCLLRYVSFFLGVGSARGQPTTRWTPRPSRYGIPKESV